MMSLRAGSISSPDDSQLLDGSPTRLRAALSKIVATLRLQWAREHLIGEAPATDAAILSSPLQQLHSLAFSTDAVHTPADGSSQTVMSSDIMFIPAFIKDGRSAGYFVEESYGIFDEACAFCQNGFSIARFVMDENDGKAVATVTNRTHILVMCFGMIGRTFSSTICAFERAAMSDLIAANDIAAYERAIHSVILTDNIRPCPTCGQPSHISCHCVLEFRRARSPLDLAVITANVLNYFGDFAGVARYEVYDNGVPVEITPLTSSYKQLNIARHGCSERLVGWAVSDRLASQPLHVARALVAPLEADRELGAPANNSQLLADPVIVPEGQDPQPHKETLSAESLDMLFSADTNLALQPSSEVSPESVHLDDDVLGANVPALNVPPAVVPVAHSNTRGRTDEIGWPWDPLVVSPIPPAQQEPAVVPQLVELPPMAPALSPVVHTSAALVPTSSPSHVMDGLRPIAPKVTAGSRLPLPSIEMSEEEIRKRTEALRAYKAYQRKIRNRESAARSNLARKQRRQAQGKRSRTGKKAATASA